MTPTDGEQGRVVIGVIGDDIHVVGNRIMQLALEESGFQVFNLRTRNRPEHFCQAALEANAHAVFVSSLNGEGEYWCADFRKRFAEAGPRRRAPLRRRQHRRRQAVEGRGRQRCSRVMASIASITSSPTSASPMPICSRI